MAQNIDGYLDELPENRRSVLQNLRQTIAAIVPDAVEGMSTKVPAFRYKGKYMVSFSATKNHLALLIMQGNAIKAFAKELEGYDTGNRIIRFTVDNPLPKDLVEKIVHFRVSEIDHKN